MKILFDISMLVLVAFVVVAVWSAAIMLWKDTLFPSWFDSSTKSRLISAVFAIAMTAAALIVSILIYTGVTSNG